MEWVDGESLHAYVERNLHQPQKLLDLAEQFPSRHSAVLRAPVFGR